MAKIKNNKKHTKKEVIFQEAAKLFKQKSYAAASMRDLADALGIVAPSLYNHIGSKGELLQMICFKVANAFTEHLVMVKNTHSTPQQELESIIRFHIRMIQENFDEVYVANQEWKHLQEPFLTNFLIQRRAYESAMIDIIETGVKKNTFRKTNPYIAVLSILSVVRGIEFWQRKKRDISADSLEDTLVDFLLNGLLK